MHGDSGQQNCPNDLRRGDVVTVRTLEEILDTLDADAKYEGIPFMPEMAHLCGMSFPVRRRAERTCVEGYGIRSLQNTVLLDAPRCDGAAHDGCQRGCLFFWKNAWLKPADARPAADAGKTPSPCACCAPSPPTPAAAPSASPAPITSVSQLPTTKGDRFYCQSTELAHATSADVPGKWQCLLHDLRIGEMTFRRFVYVICRGFANRTSQMLRGRPYYRLASDQSKTVGGELNLQPGEWVEVKSAAEIQATLDARSRNRGLEFDPEMTIHCGRRYQVAMPLRKIILEETGKMTQITNTVTLEGLTCQGLCASNCPRANHFYWREIWLKRV